MNKDYFLITSKPTDYGEQNMALIYEKEKVLKNNVYFYKRVPKNDYEILKKYIIEFYDYYEIENLETYFS